MRYFHTATEQILKGVGQSLEMVKDDEVERLVEILLASLARRGRKILVIGAGRTGLIARGFAMRLMHLGYNSYVVGETITPALEKGDLVIAVSGSGSTALVVEAAKAAKKVGAKVIAITSFRESPLAGTVDHVVHLPGRTKVAARTDYFSRQILGVHEPLLPLGTLFETNCMIFLDGIISELMGRLHIEEEELRRKHANIE